MLLTEGRRQQANRQQHFPQLSDPPAQPDVRHFSGESRKRRGMTGREAAEAAERDDARRRRAVERNQQLLELEAAEREAKAKTEAARRAIAVAEAAEGMGSEVEGEAGEKDLLSQLTDAAREGGREEEEGEDGEAPPPSSRRSTREMRKTRKLLSQQQQEELAAAATTAKKGKNGKRPTAKAQKVSQFEDLLN